MQSIISNTQIKSGIMGLVVADALGVCHDVPHRGRQRDGEILVLHALGLFVLDRLFRVFRVLRGAWRGRGDRL